ncbi:MAG: aminotransferase class V-fold PLP-dependent enzyme [Candidatus Thorarchaeota archaeon]
MTVNWGKIRKQYFPALKDLTYIMAASASPLNKKAYHKALWFYNDMLRFGDIHYDTFTEEIEILRKIIANYINSEPEEIAFLINTTSGMNIIANMLDNTKEIIYPSIEFPASIHFFRRKGFPCKKINDVNYSYPIDKYQEAVSSNTKYVINSYVQSLTGFKQDLEQVGDFCQNHDLFHIVNATQGFSSFEIDVKKQKIDMLVSNGLKWPGCGYGAGILYVNRSFFKDNLIPVSGWLSVENVFQLNNENMQIINKTRSMDGFGGCLNFGALLALKGSFELISEVIGEGDINRGVKRIQDRILWLTDEFIMLVEALNLKIITPRKKSNRSGIITIEHDQTTEIYKTFTKNKIYITPKRFPENTKDTMLRFAFNYYNNIKDINRVEKLLKALNLQ